MKTMIFKILFVSLIIVPLCAKNSQQIIKSQICSNGLDQLIDVDSKNCQKIKIALCKAEAQDDFKKVYLLYYNKDKQILIKKIFLDRYYPQGNQAKIKFSFLNYLKNRKELIILVSWKQRIKETAEGELFHVYVYHIQNQSVQKIDGLFKYEFEGIQEGKLIQAKYINRKNIERKLHKLTNLKSVCNALKSK